MRICLLTDQELDADPFDPDDWPADPRPFIPDAEWTLVTMEKDSCTAEVIKLVQQGFDIFFNLCDGAWDEGRVGVEVVQTLERLNVPFTGSDSAFFEPTREAMKRVCAAWDIPTPPYVIARNDVDLDRAARTLRFPLFVKHPQSYASYGLTPKSKVETPEALYEQAMINITQFGAALIEEFIEGRETTVLVCENPDDPWNPTTYIPMVYTFPEGESFKHYDLKWVNYEGLEAHPVEDAELAELLRDVSSRFFVGMRGAGFARCDIRVAEDGTPYMLEINPNCGIFYEPQDAGSADLCLMAEPGGHEAFARQLVAAGFARHARRQRTWEVGQKSPGDYRMYATRPIEAGETLMVFEDTRHKLVTKSFVEANWNEVQTDWFRHYAWPLTDELFVTWEDDPEDWRPVAHHCDPSAWLQGLDVVARRPLAEGDEITLDYGTFYNETMPDFECDCDAAECRGTVRGTDYLQPFIERYGPHVSDYVRRAREVAGTG